MGVFRCPAVSSSYRQVLFLLWSLLKMPFGFRWVLSILCLRGWSCTEGTHRNREVGLF